MKAIPASCAVVGSGLGALSMFYTPELLDSRIKLQWRPSQNSDIPSEVPLFLILPLSQVPQDFKTPQMHFGLKDIYVYLSGTERLRGDHFYYSDTSSNIPSALKKKILSLALFNDPTPMVWSEKESEPSAHWVHQTPFSLQSKDPFHSAIISVFTQKSLLRALENFYPLSSSPTQQKVVELNALETKGGVVTSYPPPHQAELFQYVFCTDFNQIRTQKLRSLPQMLGHWKSTVTKVPRSLISALPKFSVWTSGPSSSFRKTGQFETACLKRVFVYDLPGNSSSILQIQSFQIDKQTEQSPFEFLYSLCPRLRNHKDISHTCVLEDDYVFEKPVSFECQETKNLVFWRQALSSDSPESFRKILRKFKIKKT